MLRAARSRKTRRDGEAKGAQLIVHLVWPVVTLWFRVGLCCNELIDKVQTTRPTRSRVIIDDVAEETAFLALDGAKLITGGVMYIDGGYHIID